MIVGDYCPGLTDHIVDTGELWSSDFISSLWFKTDSITTLVKNLTDHSAKPSYPGLTVFQVRVPWVIELQFFFISNPILELSLEVLSNFPK